MTIALKSVGRTGWRIFAKRLTRYKHDIHDSKDSEVKQTVDGWITMLMTHVTILCWIVPWIWAAPGPVKDLKAILDRPTGEVILTWTPPSFIDAPLIQYVVSYQKVSDF